MTKHLKMIKARHINFSQFERIRLYEEVISNVESDYVENINTRLSSNSIIMSFDIKLDKLFPITKKTVTKEDTLIFDYVNNESLIKFGEEDYEHCVIKDCKVKLNIFLKHDEYNYKIIGLTFKDDNANRTYSEHQLNELNFIPYFKAPRDPYKTDPLYKEILSRVRTKILGFKRSQIQIRKNRIEKIKATKEFYDKINVDVVSDYFRHVIDYYNLCEVLEVPNKDGIKIRLKTDNSLNSINMTNLTINDTNSNILFELADAIYRFNQDFSYLCTIRIDNQKRDSSGRFLDETIIYFKPIK